jgi:hypothetical protein
MTYLTNISFYLALRANPPNGQDPKTHPVYQVLLELTAVVGSLEYTVEGRMDKSDDEDEDEEFKKKRKKSKKSKKKQEEIPAGFTNLLDEIADFIEGVDDLEAMEKQENESDSTLVERSIEVRTKTKKTASSGKLEAIAKKSIRKSHAMEPAVEDDHDDDLVIPEFVSLKDTSKVRGKAAKPKKPRTIVDDDDLGDEELNAIDLIDKARRKRDLKFHVTRIDQVFLVFEVKYIPPAI